MEDLIKPEVLVPVISFVAGALFALLARGIDSVVDSFKTSSNKYDDLFVPMLVTFKAALEATPAKKEDKKDGK